MENTTQSCTKWEAIHPKVYLWRDSCNVYAVVGKEGALIINAGTGAWLDSLSELPVPVVALACTHFFRDHSAGAVRASRMGVRVFVPEGEREIFVDPEQHFRQRDTYIIYDNYWDLFAPIEPIAIAGVLRDYEHLQIAGLDVEVLPLPGATIHHTGLSVKLDGQLVVFCGEAIHSPGKVARVAPYQYNYNDLSGAVDAFWSAHALIRHEADVLFPSLGVPMQGRAHCAEALEALKESLRVLCVGRPQETLMISVPESPAIEQITEHVWRTKQAVSFNQFIISKSGKALVLDYGYHELRGTLLGAYSKPYRRRALLHSLEALKAETGIDRIDVALISHFHDDHVCGVPLLQRLHGTQCWVTTTFADLLEHPERHCFPCNWPQPIKVHRRIREDEIVQWEEFTFRFAPMNGHTRFSSLIGFEADGKRYAHTGDQYLMLDAKGNWLLGDNHRDWTDKQIMHNQVYRNGALLNGLALSASWMREWRPDIVLNGHQTPYYTNEDFFAMLDRWAEDYARIHQRIMPLADTDVHFNVDSWGGWIWPYRTHMAQVGQATVKVTVRNPFSHAADLSIRLVGPDGWTGTSAILKAEARAEVSCELSITPAGPCRRQPFAVELTANGQPFGQVAEGLLSVGGSEF